MFAIIVLESGSSDASRILRSGSIYSMHQPPIVLIAVKLYRLHKNSQQMQVAGKGPPASLVARVMIFSVYSFLSIMYVTVFSFLHLVCDACDFSACIGFWSSTGAQLPYIIQASCKLLSSSSFGNVAAKLYITSSTNSCFYDIRYPRGKIIVLRCLYIWVRI